MRTLLALLVLVLFSYSTANSQYAVSEARFDGTGAGQNVSLTNPCNNQTQSVFAGVLNCTVNGTQTKFYCADFCRSIAVGDTIRDSALTGSKTIYVLNNYYPYRTSYPGKLSDNLEAASIQLSIWHFRHNLNISSVTGDNQTAIRNRANAIIADANANAGFITAVQTIQILPDIDPDAFIIKTLDQDGNPIGVNNVQVSFTGGTVNPSSVNTNPVTGLSDPIIVTGAPAGTITATAVATMPQGMIYASSGHNRQALVLAKPVLTNVMATADWGALPVELSSFVADINGRNVTLNWSTSTETNNSGFTIERRFVSGNSWIAIGEVAGKGTTTTVQEYSYTDRNLLSGKYSYRLKQTDYNGNYEYFNLNTEVEIGTPEKFSLAQNYPNPFNPSTKISYDIPSAGLVSLNVFDMSGKLVANLVNQVQQTGYYTVTMDASSLSTGAYYYKLSFNGNGNEFVATKKMLLVK
jgi:hypothetical protein